MLLLSNDQQKKYMDILNNILQKIPVIKEKISIKKEEELNIFVEKSVELVNVYETENPVIDGINEIFPLENDTFISTKPRDDIELYNTFLMYCWDKKSDSYATPESKLIESALGISKSKRLELQNSAIENKILIKSKNNKVFFSKNIDSIDEVLEKIDE